MIFLIHTHYVSNMCNGNQRSANQHLNNTDIHKLILKGCINVYLGIHAQINWSVKLIDRKDDN